MRDERREDELAEMLRSQRESWSAGAAAWDDSFAQFDAFAGPLSDELVRLAGVAIGHRVIDVGCGNGEPALTVARAVGPTGRVLGVDLAEPMVENARRRARQAGIANAEFLARDAQTVGDLGPFDAAISRFALMLVPDPPAAARAVRATLVPGARFAACVWGEPNDVPFCAMSQCALERALGVEKPQEGAPGPMRLGKPDALGAILREGGFGEVVESALRIEPRFASVEEAVRYFLTGSGAVRRTLDGRPIEDRERVAAELVRLLAARRGVDGTVELTSTVRLASGIAG